MKDNLFKIKPEGKVAKNMLKMNWSQAEDSFTEMLGKCLAYRIHVLKEDPKKAMDTLFRKCAEKGDEFANKNSLALAIASAFLQKQKEEEKAKIIPINSH